MTFSLKNPTVRYLIIKLAELAKAYQEPYDEHDMPAYENNKELFPKWEIYRDMLIDAWNGEFD